MRKAVGGTISNPLPSAPGSKKRISSSDRAGLVEASIYSRKRSRLPRTASVLFAARLRCNETTDRNESVGLSLVVEMHAPESASPNHLFSTGKEVAIKKKKRDGSHGFDHTSGALLFRDRFEKTQKNRTLVLRLFFGSAMKIRYQ